MTFSCFEALAIADQERIHSRMIAWMLASHADGGPLDAQQRSTLLSVAFAFNASVDACENLRVVTELESLDIVVFTKGALLVIENKLKSRQSAGQLERYDSAVKKLQGRHPEVVAIEKRFLTFIGEESMASEWRDMDYRRLLDGLLALAADNAYVRDYTAMLGRLLDRRDDFLEDHVRHARVITRSGMSSADRLAAERFSNETEVERYTFQNRLERAFCEALLARAASALQTGLHYVGETRGQALVDSRLFTVEFSDGKKYHCGLQLQGSTVKLNLGAIDYQGSRREEIRHAEALLDAAVHAAMLTESPGTALRPQAAHSKAYRSWVYQLHASEALEAVSLGLFVSQHGSRLHWAMRVWNMVLVRLKGEELVRSFERSLHL